MENIEQETSQTPEQATTQPAETTQQPKEYSALEKQLYERVKKLEATKSELESRVASQKPSDLTDGVNQIKTALDEVDQKVELRMAGYSRDEIADIDAIAKAKKISLEEAAKLPLVSKGIEALRAEKRSTEATPTPSNRVKVFNGKPVDDILKDPNTSKEDKQSAWEAKLRGNRGANQSV